MRTISTYRKVGAFLYCVSWRFIVNVQFEEFVVDGNHFDP